VDALVARATAMGLAAVRLPVSHAFHSPLVADVSPLEVVRQLAARRAELPPASATEAAMATIGEVAEALKELALHEAERGRAVEEALPAGVDSWIRTFSVEHVERPLPPRRVEASPGRWRVIAPKDHPLADPLQKALNETGGGNGVAGYRWLRATECVAEIGPECVAGVAGEKRSGAPEKQESGASLRSAASHPEGVFRQSPGHAAGWFGRSMPSRPAFRTARCCRSASIDSSPACRPTAR